MTATATILALTMILASPVAATPEFYLVYEGQEGGCYLVRTPQLLAT